MADAYRMVVRGGKLTVLIERLHIAGSPASAAHIGGMMRQAGEIVRARAIYNVSGYPVRYEGGTFRVMVRTGALKGSLELQYPHQSLFTARVFVNGTHTSQPASVGGYLAKPRPVSEYAGAIEWGHKEIDLKKTMMGRRVPFFASRGQRSLGPYSARGLAPVVPGHTKNGALFENEPLNAKLAARGINPMRFQRRGGGKAAYGKGGGGAYFISFRTVGKTGWIIPAARPRPFLRAALEGTQDQVRRMLVRGTMQMLKP